MERVARIRTRPTWSAAAWLLAAALAASVAAGVAAAQGSPSGDYGEVPLGGSVEGVLAGAGGAEPFVYHTYVVPIAAGSGPVTVRVEGFGSDIDLAVKFGAPIFDYDHVDHLDISDDPDPSYTFDAPAAGPLYVDVLNLLSAPARYRLHVSAAAAGGTNPLAAGAADALLGTFEGDGLRVTVRSEGGAYAGELIMAGQAYPFQASGASGRLDGAFVAGASSFPFSATLTGDTLTVESGGSSYRTQRLGGGPAAPVNPLGGAGSGPAPSDPVVARGPHGTLTQANARAFVEALEFSLAQVGYQQPFTHAERQQLLEALGRNYSTLAAADQAVLAQAGDVWDRVQANWHSASPDEREEFVLGVFVLAFGEAAVRQALGGGPGRPGSTVAGDTGCGTIDECMSRYTPEAYQQTLNAQSCWAAAGCESYDSEFNTFTYDSYDGN